MRVCVCVCAYVCDEIERRDRKKERKKKGGDVSPTRTSLEDNNYLQSEATFSSPRLPLELHRNTLQELRMKPQHCNSISLDQRIQKFSQNSQTVFYTHFDLCIENHHPEVQERVRYDIM